MAPAHAPRPSRPDATQVRCLPRRESYGAVVHCQAGGEPHSTSTYPGRSTSRVESIVRFALLAAARSSVCPAQRRSTCHGVERFPGRRGCWYTKNVAHDLRSTTRHGLAHRCNAPPSRLSCVTVYGLQELLGRERFATHRSATPRQRTVMPHF
jgi:hypothetical protein